MGLLDAIRRVGRVAPAATPRLEVEGRRVLLVYFFPALGDAVLLAPVVSALVEAGARPPVGLLLRAGAARMWRHVDLPVRLHVLPDELAALPEPEDDAGTAAVLKLQVALRKASYDIAVDLTFREDVDARRWLDRAEPSARLGYRSSSGRTDDGLFWGAVDERNLGLDHWTHYLAAPLAPLDLGPLPTEIPFRVSPAATDKAEGLWGASPRVLLVPGSRSPEKRFAPTTFVAAGRFAVSRGGSVVVVGGPEERGLVGQVASEVGTGAQPYTGRSLGPLVHLARTADAVVTNDTGPMHLAFLSGTATVAIFTTMGAPCWGPMDPADPRFVALTVPPGAADTVAPVVERLVLERLRHHLDRK